MNRRQLIFSIFIICLILTGLIYFLGKNGEEIAQFIFSPLQKLAMQTTQIFTVQDSKVKIENTKLSQELAKMKMIQADNASLRDQFQTQTPSPKSLIPATIVGKPSFFPGISQPEAYIINVGKANGLSLNTSIVYKDNLIGKIVEINDHFAKVQIISNKSVSFTGKTAQSGAIGIIRGQGNGEMTLENVLLSDTLNVGDMVVTSGETDIHGQGFPPGLVIGKITSVEKNPSSLFQKASIVSLVDFSKLSIVFALIQQ